MINFKHLLEVNQILLYWVIRLCAVKKNNLNFGEAVDKKQKLLTRGKTEKTEFIDRTPKTVSSFIFLDVLCKSQ